MVVAEQQLKVGEVGLSDHGYERAVERLELKYKDRNSVLGFLRKVLKEAICLGEVLDEDENWSVLYAKNRIAIYLSLDLKTIITVNRFENVTFEPIKEKLKGLCEKELRKLRRKERCLVRRNERELLKCKVELAELDLRAYKTRSNNVRKQCKERKKEIEKYIADMEKELKNVRDTIRRVSKSLVSVI
jgi:hypothetical protein